MSLRRIADAASEPVTVAEAKAALDYGRDDRDTYIAGLIKAARIAAENELWRSLVTQQWELTRDTFPLAGIRLDYPPLVSVQSVQYLDATTGAVTTLSAASYVVDAATEPGWIQPAFGFDWPATYAEINAVRIRFIAGTEVADVPQSLKLWIIANVGHWLENKEASTPDRLIATPFLDGLLNGSYVRTF